MYKKYCANFLQFASSLQLTGWILINSISDEKP